MWRRSLASRRSKVPRRWAGLLLLLCAGLAEAADPATPARPNGFDLSAATVDVEQIIAGGPARDAISSVDAPSFVAPGEATWVKPDTPVIGVVVGEVARAYPVHAMEYHQIVNDAIGGVPIALTYDPLTDSAIAYERRLAGEAREFGVSGLVYNSNFLLFDRSSDSLFSQMLGRALSGPLVGRTLKRIRSRTEPFGVFLERHRKAGIGRVEVMKLPMRKRIDYRYSPYSAYWVSPEVPFPVRAGDDRFHPKEPVLGARVGERSRAYVATHLRAAGARVVDEFEGHRIRIEFDEETGTFSFEAPEAVELTSAYWFAWKAFHPTTDIWRAEGVLGSTAKPD